MRGICPYLPGLFACLALLACPALAETSLERGERLFLRGQAPSSVSARVGPDDGVAVPLQSVACARCHGADAAGRSEGGVAAPAIDWFRLTKPWGHGFEDGRKRPAYDAGSFHRALVQGLDPSGNRLDGRMPRFSLSSADSGALFEFIRNLKDAPRTGVDAGEVRIAYPDMPGASLASGVMERIFEAASAGGGIFGRKIRLVPLRRGGAQVDFAGVVCATPLEIDRKEWGIDREAWIFGCSASTIDSGFDKGLRLLATPAERVDMLREYARQRLGIDAKRIKVMGQSRVVSQPMAIISQNVDTALLAEIRQNTGLPWVLLAHGEILMGSSTLPEGFEHLRERTLAALPVPLAPAEGNYESLQVRLARGTASIVIEALRLTGHDLTAERLVQTMQKMTGISVQNLPVISFAPGRNYGLDGIHVAYWETNQWKMRENWFRP